MAPKNASSKSASKKRSRVVVDLDSVSDEEEVLPTKTTKRTHAHGAVNSKFAVSPTETPAATKMKSEKAVTTKSKPTAKSTPVIEDKSDNSDDEPLKRQQRPKPRPKHSAASKEITATSTPVSAPTKTPAPVRAQTTTKVLPRAKSNDVKSKDEGGSLSKSGSNSSHASHIINSNGSQKKGNKKQPLTSTQMKPEELKNRENRDQASSVQEELAVPKKNKSQRAPPALSLEQLQVAYDDLKERYNHLTSLRTTEAEQHLEEYRFKLQAANGALEQYKSKVEPQLEASWRTQDVLRSTNETLNAKVRSLQHKLRDYEAREKQRAKEDRTLERAKSMEQLLASPDVNRQSASFVKAMEMYQNLTGLKVTARNQHLWGKPSPTHSSDVHPETWDCEHSGPLGTLKFALSYDTKTDLVTYTPSIDPIKEAKLLESLPEYMTVEIEFERQFECKLFWRILNYNHEQDDES